MLLAEWEVRHPSNEIRIFIIPNAKGIFQSLRFVQEEWKKLCVCRCPLTSLSDGRYSPAGLYLWSTESIQCSWGRVFTRRFLFHKLQVKGWKSPSLRDTCHRKSRILCLLCLVCFFVLLLVSSSTSQYVYRILFHCCCDYCCCHLFTIYDTSEHSTLKVNDVKFDFYEI